MKSSKFKKDQHVGCKYKGDNGDLIVGRITSVRSNGDVVLMNLLTDTKALKKADVLDKRNQIISKRDAMGIVEMFKKTGNRAATRSAMVALVSSVDQNSQLPFQPFLTLSVDELVTKFRMLPHTQQEKFISIVFNTASANA